MICCLRSEKQWLIPDSFQRKWALNHLEYLANNPEYFDFQMDWAHPLYKALGGKLQRQVTTTLIVISILSVFSVSFACLF